MKNLTFAIGDIHGCIEQLRKIIFQIETHWPGGNVVFLGDYVDRGPDSKSVIEFLRKGPQSPAWRWVCLKGNHEAMMADAFREEDVALWIGNGGRETLQSYTYVVPEDVVEWMEDLPLIHIDAHRIFVHAGIDERFSIENQTEHSLLWSRKPPHYSGVYWGKHVCHGHTPHAANPTTIGNRTNVDSGCVFYGKLSCAVFDDDISGGPIEFVVVGAGT